MKAIKNLWFILLYINFQSIYSQNLLNTNTWTVGSGSVTGFSQNGSTTENIRELGRNHVGENVILWKAIPDASSNADGGWNSSYHNINNARDYRFSVWIKKTNSKSGNTYFGCQQWQPDSSIHDYTILNFDNIAIRNPYFFVGDLPKLDRWYLLVGFIRSKNFPFGFNEGGIYDGLTGEKVLSTTDFKFSPSTTRLRHRAYLYYDTNTADRQYFYKPRLEQVNHSIMPSVNDLLSLNPDSQLTFTYDTAGNQTERFYCPDACGSAGKKTNKKETDEIVESIEPEVVNFEEQLSIFPNPTKGFVSINIGVSLLKKISSVNVYSSNSSLIRTLKVNSQDLKVDLTDMPSGIYFLHIHMNDGSNSITKKIIKN
ncbi:T9SS type A sorting domain-containing protein [Flavivirga algicola]|uniref:T9SS type A sorting domain-containing protein n=1 Tax=Flavivirga algicola TaxID=2729136 RepID=A0ABX1S1Z0_9FLAO|nr:T9SS type A sorting domain-containing protein [Flavivirga algicola]NMH89895.1 T9SS type A sorting domain-containing protein [Flavivirga algicola]